MTRARSARQATVGVIGLLAIAGGTVANATPSWAQISFVAINNAPAGTTVTINALSCSDLCALNGAQSFQPGAGLTFNVDSGGGATLGGNFGAAQQFGFSVNSVSGNAANMTCAMTGIGTLVASADSSYYSCEVYQPSPNSSSSSGAGSGSAAGVATDAIDLRGNTRIAHVRIATNKALVKKGSARVRVVSTATTRFKVDERIVLRNSKGKVLGKATTRVTTGKLASLKVPLPQHIRKKLRDGKQVTVTARVKHAGKIQGTGDYTTRLVLSTR